MESTYKSVAEFSDATVVAEYFETYGKKRVRSEAYQSEAELEKEFIRMLGEQGYEYLQIHNEAGLIDNLRKQLEKLNDITFTDNEWKSFFSKVIGNPNLNIVDKTRMIQEEHIQLLQRDDGSVKNICLIDKRNVHNNCLQVLNQYVENRGNFDNRYDVTVLVNGLPLIHVELKRRGVAIREAFNQINRYQRDSFWAGSGLFEFVQIFVISNGTHTKYYSNTTRESHIRELDKNTRNKSKKTSNSFEFTSYWADGTNRVIADLVDFTRTFFSKHTILNILTKYCVFTAQNILMVMRPYQITAAERIINRVVMSTNYKSMGSVKAGGYIWHTTGSGKTLTSFKTSQLISRMDGIDKVMFVVDRKDLDYQTKLEYDKFQKGAVSASDNTRMLEQNLKDPAVKIVITTIQKLSVMIKKADKKDAVFGKHIVILFDECHRSQFGEMHSRITKAFKKYHIFGFTGTPIISGEEDNLRNPNMQTTEKLFGDRLHTYTIVDAIRDENVLPFRIDYINTLREKADVEDSQIRSIDREKALLAPERVSKIVSYIIEHFDQKTCRNKYYSLNGQRQAGFNSIFAVASIEAAKKYYYEFKKQLAEKHKDLKIATIFSFAPNEAEPDEENFDAESLDQTSREFLEEAISDYNAIFGTPYDTSSKQFEGYYENLSLMTKQRKIDILIVVNMFLTGFDATTLNTLWVDKYLRMHGLIQAFSRTNRILNSVKKFGNIVSFRDLDAETNKALALFGDKDAHDMAVLRPFNDYYYGYDDNGKHFDGYKEIIDKLKQEYPIDVTINGESAEKDFVRTFSAFLRVRNILVAFDQFEGKELLTEREVQDYQSIYLDLLDKYRSGDGGGEGGGSGKGGTDVSGDVEFELELIKQVEVNIDYILMLVERYRASGCKDQDVLLAIDKAVGSSPELRSKKDLIREFVAKVNVDTKVQEDWRKFIEQKKTEELDAIIADEKLKPDETNKLMADAFRDGELQTGGLEFDGILPRMGRFSGSGKRAEKKKTVVEKIKAFFDKYVGLIFK